MLRVEANYLLLHEHYLDLTDVFVTHPEVVPPDIQQLPPLNEVEISERSVAYTRSTPPSRLAPWESAITGLPEESVATRREEGTFVSPALHTQHYAIELEDGESYGLLRIHGFTPESPGSTHVFLQMARNYAGAEDSVTEYLRIMFHEWAVRDAAILETIQRRLDEPGARRRDINVKADRAAIRARRIAMDMVDDETSRFTAN